MLESEVCRVDPEEGQLLVRRQADATRGRPPQPARLAGRPRPLWKAIVNWDTKRHGCHLQDPSHTWAQPLWAMGGSAYLCRLTYLLSSRVSHSGPPVGPGKTACIPGSDPHPYQSLRVTWVLSLNPPAPPLSTQVLLDLSTAFPQNLCGLHGSW